MCASLFGNPEYGFDRIICGAAVPQAHVPVGYSSLRFNFLHIRQVTRMPPSVMSPLGYRAALSALEKGRSEFFGGAEVDLPESRSAEIAKDDLIPQFGFVGSSFARTRVLLIGINPGNGPDGKRTAGDEIAMPVLRRFFEERSEVSFSMSQHAYKGVCESWPMWRRHCSEVIGAGRLLMDEVAYTNCLPWRTNSKSTFSDDVGRRAAQSYAYPLIDELNPKVIIALGKRAASILKLGGRDFEDLIVWNRAQAATKEVIADRTATAARILQAIGRKVQ